MKVLAILILFLIACGVVWGSATAVSQERPEQKSVLSPDELTHAKSVFHNKCSRCHGADGRGQTVLGEMLGIPDFTDAKWWQDRDDEGLIKSITHGNGEMPAFGKKLTKSEISLMAAYVRLFKKSKP